MMIPTRKRIAPRSALCLEPVLGDLCPCPAHRGEDFAVLALAALVFVCLVAGGVIGIGVAR